MLSLLSTLLFVFTPLNSGYPTFSRRAIILNSIGSKTLYSNINSGDDDSNAIIHTIKNNIYYSGPLSEQSIFAITTNLITLQNRDNTEINLHIQSHGGALLPSLGLVDVIRTSDIPINTYIDGYVASAATLVSIVGANRFISKHGTMLIHQLKMGGEYGKYNEIKDYAENADTLMNIIKSIYLEYSNMKEPELDTLLSHDLWMNATKCKELGLVDILV